MKRLLFALLVCVSPLIGGWECSHKDKVIYISPTPIVERPNR